MVLQEFNDLEALVQALKPFMKQACDDCIQPVYERLGTIDKAISRLDEKLGGLEHLSFGVESSKKKGKESSTQYRKADVLQAFQNFETKKVAGVSKTALAKLFSTDLDEKWRAEMDVVMDSYLDSKTGDFDYIRFLDWLFDDSEACAIEGTTALCQDVQPSHDNDFLIVPIDDTSQWCTLLKARRQLRNTGGCLPKPALTTMPKEPNFESALQAAITAANDARRHRLEAIQEDDMKAMAEEEPDEKSRSMAQSRMRSKASNVNIYLQNAIFFEGLYRAFPSQAAQTKVIPYNGSALAAVADRSDCDTLPGKLTFSENGVGSLDAIEHYSRQCGLRCAGTNFAHPVRAGGHYEQGSATQEEDLCRRAPNFWPSIVSEKASAGFCDATGENAGTHVDSSPSKIHAQIKLTTNVHILREHRGAFLPASRWFSTAIVTIAAPCFHPQALGVSDHEAKKQAREFLLSEDGKLAVMDSMRSMILGPLTQDPSLDVIVLGAWGCGAFRLDWNLVMEYFRDVILETRALSKYKEIHFPLFEKEHRGLGAKFQNIWAGHANAERILSR